MEEGSEVASDEPNGCGEGDRQPPGERTCPSICQSLLGIHLGSPTDLPKEIQLLLWYHQLHELGVLESEEYSWKKRQLLATPSDLTATPPSSGQLPTKEGG